MQTVLVTGGAGYIGSNVCVELLKNDYTVIIADNLSNSSIKRIDDIKAISGKDIFFYNININAYDKVDEIFCNHKIDIVIHLAGLKAVGESTKNPLLYYDTNINMTINLLKIMQKNNCKKIIFSSSSVVYGDNTPPFYEHYTSNNIINPYGKTKYIIEQILLDLYKSDNSWNIIILRYFNPGGKHESGLLADNYGVPNNILPYMEKITKNELPYLVIYGNDYNTPDGTCIRDYIHVVDIAKAHLSVFNKFNNNIHIYNLGTGKGVSVLQLVNTFINVNKLDKFKYIIGNRRQGDIPILVSDVSKAKRELEWETTKSLEDICKL